MLNNTFSGKRFALLCKQHLIHNTQLLVLSTMAYVGSVFIVLSIAQIGSELRPNDVERFQELLVGFVFVFGALYAGHAFPAFRAKESTMSYLMVPASLPEKFVFEFISRIVIMLVALPLLYWVTFHLQGYLFAIFATESFEPVSVRYLVVLNEQADADFLFWIYIIAIAAVFLAFALMFAGAAMFTKQPLVKTLFSLTVIVIFYVTYTYFVVVHLGIGDYNPPDSMWLVPLNEAGILKFFSALLTMAFVIIMFVAYRKLKEREV